MKTNKNTLKLKKWEESALPNFVQIQEMLKNSGKIQKKDLVGTPFHEKQTPLEENYGYEFVKKAITAVL